MFAYNPSQQNLAGEMILRGQTNADNTTMQGVQALGHGIDQGADGVAQSMNQLSQYQRQFQQAQGTLDAAGAVGAISQDMIDQLKLAHPMQQIGAANSIGSLINSMGMINFRNEQLKIKQENADTLAERVGSLKSQTPLNLY